MSNARIVAGALIEGDGEGTDGDAGSWIKLVLMLEEVRATGFRTCTVVFVFICGYSNDLLLLFNLVRMDACMDAGHGSLCAGTWVRL